MEYVDGTDLSSLVKKRGPLPIDQAMDCILQAARGLEYAHEHGVVHRTSSRRICWSRAEVESPEPEGGRSTDDPIRLSSLDSGHWTVKILDMGLARLDSAGGQQDQLTGSVRSWARWITWPLSRR